MIKVAALADSPQGRSKAEPVAARRKSHIPI